MTDLLLLMIIIVILAVIFRTKGRRGEEESNKEKNRIISKETSDRARKLLWKESAKVNRERYRKSPEGIAEHNRAIYYTGIAVFGIVGIYGFAWYGRLHNNTLLVILGLMIAAIPFYYRVWKCLFTGWK